LKRCRYRFTHASAIIASRDYKKRHKLTIGKTQKKLIFLMTRDIFGNPTKSLWQKWLLLICQQQRRTKLPEETD